jgi:hypothetical protein
MKDKNLISFNGDDTGNIWRNGVLIFGPPDKDETGAEEIRSWTEDLTSLVVPPGTSDTLKFSRVRNLSVVAVGILEGGSEDCIDINNKCRNIFISVPHGIKAFGQYVATIKGGSTNIHLRGMIMQHGSTVDVDLGNWSDQSRDITSNVSLDIWTNTGKPVKWRMLNAAVPKLIGSKYQKALSVPSFLRKAFVLFYSALKKIGLG